MNKKRARLLMPSKVRLLNTKGSKLLMFLSKVCKLVVVLQKVENVLFWVNFEYIETYLLHKYIYTCEMCFYWPILSVQLDFVGLHMFHNLRWNYA